MAVHDQADAEDTVEDGVVAAGGGEGGDCKRDKAGGQQALERPVVRAVRAGRRREGCGVVHGALEDGCRHVQLSVGPQCSQRRETTYDRPACRSGLEQHRWLHIGLLPLVSWSCGGSMERRNSPWTADRAAARCARARGRDERRARVEDIVGDGEGRKQ